MKREWTKPRKVTGCGLVLSLAAVGCVMPDQISETRKGLEDVRAELARLQQDNQASSERLAALSDLAETRVEDSETISRAEFADLAVRVDRLSRDAAIAGDRMNELDHRLDRVLQETQRATALARQQNDPLMGPVPPTDPDTGAVLGTGGSATGLANAAIPDPEALYNTAYADFSKGNYALAVSGFSEYQERFPDSSLADNALYWVAECHFSQGDFREAVRASDQLLERYPDSDKAAATNLKKALAYLEQNDIGKAIVQLRYVESAYGSSDEAKIARDKLASLGASL